MSSIFQQHCQAFANEELERRAIMHALLGEYKKLTEVDIDKAIDAQFESDDLDEMLACGMSIQDVVNYIDDNVKKLKDILESISIATYNLQLFANKTRERFGGNYNDQT